MEQSEIINKILRNTEEVVTPQELEVVTEMKTKKAYIGFEPSGLMHVAQGFIYSSKIRDLTDVGFEVTIFLADWHAYINDKLGGNIDNLKLYLVKEKF